MHKLVSNIICLSFGAGQVHICLSFYAKNSCLLQLEKGGNWTKLNQTKKWGTLHQNNELKAAKILWRAEGN